MMGPGDNGPRVTLAHDYLTEMGGAQRVAAAFARLFQDAPVITAAIRPDVADPVFRRARVRTTWLQHFMGQGTLTSAGWPLLALTFRVARVAPCDILLSSTTGLTHHLRPPRGALHVTYCHVPSRPLWDDAAFFQGRPGVRTAIRPWLPLLRTIDARWARGVDVWIANSRYTAARIQAFYDRSATVLHPPVPVDAFRPTEERSGRFLVVSRLVRYKRIEVAVRAAALAGLPLDIIGEGADRSRLEALAGPHVRFLGRASDAACRAAMARCTALLVPGVEDFGLAIAEAQASGRPPIALAAGGALEIVEDGETGFLVGESTPEAFARAMRRAIDEPLAVDRLRSSAARFDVARFETELLAVLRAALETRVPKPIRAQSRATS